MMTIKLRTTYSDGETRIKIFPADSVEYITGVLNNPQENKKSGNTPFISFKQFLDQHTYDDAVGGGADFDKPYYTEYAFLSCKNDGDVSFIIIMPYTEVYIMQDGKTVDMFRIKFLD